MALGNCLSVVVEFARDMVLPAALLALSVSLGFFAAGWRARRALLRRQGDSGRVQRFELGQTLFASGLLDVANEVSVVLQQFEGIAARNLVRLETAIQPRLTVRADARVFREILAGLVAHAIGQTPCGRVLLGATRSGGRVQVTVCDDGAGVDRGLQASKLRPAERLAVLQGATMEVDARSGQGTTVVLRLPESGAARRDATRAGSTDPASVWAPPAKAASWETHGADR